MAIVCVGMGEPALHPQNVSAKRAGIQTERQKVAALQEAKRLGLQAELAEKQGKVDESERLAQRALLLEEQVRGASHIEVGSKSA